MKVWRRGNKKMNMGDMQKGLERMAEAMEGGRNSTYNKKG